MVDLGIRRARSRGIRRHGLRSANRARRRSRRIVSANSEAQLRQAGEFPGNLASDTQKKTWQKDYVGYVVVCPSIPGCYSQGKTLPEALANIREAIDVCLEDMESRGEEIPDPNNVLIGSVVVTR